MTYPLSSMIVDGALHVDGEVFTVVGGELHNSSASTLQAIDASFTTAAALGVNTILAPVSWEAVEPTEGHFDFTLVDAMITAATSRGVRLIPLWFGSWKNGQSTYVPGWVKCDPERFERAHTAEGTVEVLSTFSDPAREADARAFAQLAAHIAAVDEHRTVIMIQVENEVGLLGDSRDRSPLAQAAWDSPVPPKLVETIASSTDLVVRAQWEQRGSRRSGTWGDVLGDSPEAGEAFMAWAYARYVGVVAAAGRAELNVPMFVNAWQDAAIDLDLPDSMDIPQTAVAGGQQPGMYPSGGPVVRVAEIWRATAPVLDFLAPDIYFGDFDDICRGYRRVGGGLFIPEMRRGVDGVAAMFTAIGSHSAIGVAPFGVDSLALDSLEARTLTDAYRLLRAIPAGTEPRAGFALTETSPAAQVALGDITVHVSAARPFGFAEPSFPAYGLAVLESDHTLLIAARGVTVSFTAGTGRKLEILSVAEIDQEGNVVRWRNGDETGSGSGVRFAELHPAASTFPIPTWDDSTGVMRIQLYTHD